MAAGEHDCPTGAPATDVPVVCALIAAHNRRVLTLAGLQALQASARAGEVLLCAVLVDDGSRDGTAEAVEAACPWVKVVRAAGDLYWCRAMHRAWIEALAVAGVAGRRPTHFLWLNDDTRLRPAALSTLLHTAVERQAALGRPVIVVGTAADPRTGRPSYGGGRLASRWRRTSWRLVPPEAHPQEVEVMDGNVVLLPADVIAQVGNLDAAFEHAMGDYDYALRARRRGVPVWLAPGVLADCATNPRSGFRDPALSLRARWRAAMDRKGLPWRSWLRFTRRHAGLGWPVFFVWPYLRVLWPRLGASRPGG